MCSLSEAEWVAVVDVVGVRVPIREVNTNQHSLGSGSLGTSTRSVQALSHHHTAQDSCCLACCPQNHHHTCDDMQRAESCIFFLEIHDILCMIK